MPLNLSGTGNTSNITFGPAVLYMGVSGTTPTVDVGLIDLDDGVKFTQSKTVREIRQGTAALIEYAFAQQQDASLEFSSIEWNGNTHLTYGMGAGVTASSASQDTVEYGGDPIITTVALDVRHAMPVSGQTLDIYMYKAFSDSTVESQFGGGNEAKYPYKYKAMRSPTNWAGTALAYNKQLFKIIRQKT